MISPGGTIDRVMSTGNYNLSEHNNEQIIISGGGGHLELLRRGFKKWSIEDFDVPKCLAKRGVLDSKVWSNYFQ